VDNDLNRLRDYLLSRRVSDGTVHLRHDRPRIPWNDEDRLSLQSVTAPGSQEVDAFRTATRLAAIVGRQLLSDFSVEDMIGEALSLYPCHYDQFAADVRTPTIHTIANLIEPGTAPDCSVSNGRWSRYVASTMAATIAAGLVLLAAEWWGATPEEVMCWLESELGLDAGSAPGPDNADS
jgi:hypothetical protein